MVGPGITVRDYVAAIARRGAEPLPTVALNTRVPGLGPYRMSGAVYDLVVYPGPLMRYSAVPTAGGGRLLGVA